MTAVKTAVYVLAWEFMVIMVFLILNTFLFGYAVPIFDDIANQSMSAEGFAAYESRSTPIKAGMLVAFFIMVLTPFAYLFVRLLLKREQTAPPYYQPGY